MRHYIYAFTILGVLVGCHRPVEPIPEIVPPVENKVEDKPIQVVPVVPPVKPQAPNTTYLKGYSDGYFGNWLAPAQFALNPDYRNGRGEGATDREKGLPFRYQQR